MAAAFTGSAAATLLARPNDRVSPQHQRWQYLPLAVFFKKKETIFY